MNDPQKRIISVTTTLAVVLVLIIVLASPVGYFLLEYHALNHVLKARAETKAIFAGQIILKDPDLWQFETIRLEHFLSDQATSAEPEEQRITDLKGQVVAQTTGHLPRPVHTVSHPLFESGRVVGYLEISRSLRPFLNHSLFLGALTLLLGVAVYLTLKFYPLRALSQTLTLLSQERQRFRVIFQSSLMAVALLDRDCTILDANSTFSYLTFMSPQELRGHNFLDLVSLEPRENLATLFRELQAGQRESFHLEMCYQRRDGVVNWGDLSVFALQTELGENNSCFVMFNDITERKAMEEKLARSLSLQNATLESTADGILVADLHGRMVSWNQKFMEIWSMPEELWHSRDEKKGLAHILEQLVEPEEFLRKVKSLYTEPAAESFDTLHFKDGRIFERYSIPQYLDREIVGRVWSFRDVTTRKRTEEALKESENKFRRYIEWAPLAVIVVDREGNLIETNRAAAEMLGYDEAAFAHITILDLHPEEDRESILEDFAALIREGHIEIERRFKRSNGQILWGSLRAVMLESQFSLGFCQDITERKLAEEALEQSEAKYRALVETSYDWIWEVDAQARYTYAAPKVTGILGYTPEEMLGRTPFEFMPEDEALRLQAAFAAIAADRLPFAALENVNFHKDGRRILLETSGVPIFDPKGEFAGYLGTDRDITARRQAEQALQEAIRRRILMEQSRDGIVVLDHTGKVYEANHRYAEMLGYSAEEVRQLYVWDWDAQWTREELMEKVRLVDAAGEHFETRHRRKDGTLFDVEISTNGAVLAGQKLVFCVCRDISERKRAEAEIHRQRDQLRELATRLAKIQELERHQLAQELHDQICQNLAAIDLTLESLKIRAKQESLEQLLVRLADASALVEQAGEVARDIMEGLRPTVLEHFGLMGALRQLRGQFAQRTGVGLEIIGEAAAPRLSPEVELALFRIAQEALANVSKHAKAHRVTLTLEAEADLVRLSIADDGIGFDRTKVDQVRGRHGWGFMTMAERAIAVGGHCRVESQPGQGTRVLAEVPMVLRVVSAQTDADAKPE